MPPSSNSKYLELLAYTDHIQMLSEACLWPHPMLISSIFSISPHSGKPHLHFPHSVNSPSKHPRKPHSQDIPQAMHVCVWVVTSLSFTCRFSCCTNQSQFDYFASFCTTPSLSFLTNAKPFASLEISTVSPDITCSLAIKAAMG